MEESYYELVEETDEKKMNFNGYHQPEETQKYTKKTTQVAEKEQNLESNQGHMTCHVRGGVLSYVN